MKFLLDMNLSPSWLSEFQQRDVTAVHWSQIGDGRAADTVIMQYARENGYIVFTHDLDFGAMLAVTGAAAPSVIQIRVQDISPEVLAERFFEVIEQFEEPLIQGALIIVDLHKNRVRLLPLQP